MANAEKQEQAAEGLWTPCPKCREILFLPELERNLKVCRKCNFHFRLRAQERIDLLLDEGSFLELDGNLITVNPLEFHGYPESIGRYQGITGTSEAALSGEGTINGAFVSIAVTDSHFLMGSMASVVGEQITRALERACDRRSPCVLVSASGGGARMQEGLLSLMQMAKTSGAVARHHSMGLLCVVILTDPSMAGVLASWGFLGDVLIAEPGAMIGFVGQRVSQQAGVSKMPAEFQTAEFQMRHGQIDLICQRRELKETVSKIISFAHESAGAPVEEAVHGR